MTGIMDLATLVPKALVTELCQAPATSPSLHANHMAFHLAGDRFLDLEAGPHIQPSAAAKHAWQLQKHPGADGNLDLEPDFEASLVKTK